MLTFFFLSAYTQITFQKKYGTWKDEHAQVVQQTSDGGYILAGSQSESGMNPDGYIVRVNEFGDTLWTRTYARIWSSGLYSIVETTNGFLAVGGAVTTIGPARSDLYLLKINHQGDTLWSKTYGGPRDDSGREIKPTADGGFIIAGNYDEAYNWISFYLLKIDALGDTLWTRKYGLGTGYRAYGRAVEQTSDGGYLIAGYVDEYSTDFEDVYLVKTDSLGIVEWTKLFDWSDHDLAYDMQEIADGYVMAGMTHYLGEGRWNIFMLRTNSLGDSMWLKIYGDSLDDRGYAVKQTTDGGFILSAWTTSWGAGSFDYYLIKTDSNGDTLWTRLFGGNSHEYAYDVIQTQDGGYAVAGASFSQSAGWGDYYLVKTDGNGYLPILSQQSVPVIEDFQLNQNYPNPFNPTTCISWQLAVGSWVTISLYNLSGQRIAVLINEKQAAGYYSLEFDASNLASGVYFYQLEVADPLKGSGQGYVQTRKMLLIK